MADFYISYKWDKMGIWSIGDKIEKLKLKNDDILDF